jgi:hypothetical protein
LYAEGPATLGGIQGCRGPARRYMRRTFG